MTETSQPNTTKINRRAAMFGSAALASVAFAALDATAHAAIPSREFVAQQQAWRAHKDHCAEGDYDEAIANRLCLAHEAALAALVEAVDAERRPSLNDVLELAQAQRDACYEDLAAGEYIGESSSGIEPALVRAVLKMGGLSF